MRRLYNFIRSLFGHKPVRLAIVRRYQDANGSYVGELYVERHGFGYAMIGASLDTLPLDASLVEANKDFELDTRNDFLAPMHRDTVRVGALDPRDNDDVRRTIAGLPRRNMTLMVRNGFIQQLTRTKL